MKVKVCLTFFCRICILCAYMRPRYQVSVYRTIGPLVFFSFLFFFFNVDETDY